MCNSLVFKREGDALTRNRPLDQKDVDIIGALDKLGGKTSTEELSQATNIPARTVRYRLQKLRDAKILHNARTFTHERKLGLGENILLLHTTPGSKPILEKMFRNIDCIYWWTSTYGTYNGFLIHALYSLATPSVSTRLLEAFQSHGLILDYFVFDVTDYEHKYGDFRYFKPNEGWNYDWKEWYKKINKTLKSNPKKINTKCDENPPLIDYDNYDYGLLRGLYDNAMVAQKDLAKKFSLSETQVTKRIRRLEKEGVLKYYGPSFSMTKSLVYFHLYMEIEEPVAKVMNNFYTHPFLGSIIQESRTRWGIRIDLSPEDMKGFLLGVDLLRPYLKSCIFQVLLPLGSRKEEEVKGFHPYDLFNSESHKWETPLSKYIQVINNIASESK